MTRLERLSRRAKDLHSKQPLVAQMPAGIIIGNAANACVVRCKNLIGPLGSNVIVRQQTLFHGEGRQVYENELLSRHVCITVEVSFRNDSAIILQQHKPRRQFGRLH